jgi:L-alanine-DL-glutamate epimerase-like enolase superfamily enzyme
MAAMAALRGATTAVGIYAESALGTLINLQQPGTMAAEQTFFLTMTDQVSTLLPRIRDGRIELPEEPDLSKLVDWERVRRFAYNT